MADCVTFVANESSSFTKATQGIKSLMEQVNKSKIEQEAKIKTETKTKSELKEEDDTLKDASNILGKFTGLFKEIVCS